MPAKSNVVDALRAARPRASGRRSWWFEPERDLHFGCAPTDPIGIELRYTALTSGDEALFMGSLVDGDGVSVHGTQFDARPGLTLSKRWPYRRLGGRSRSRVPRARPDRSRLSAGPARSERGARGSRLREIFELMAADDQLSDFRSSANVALATLAGHAASNRVVAGVQRHLTSVTQPVRHRTIGLHRKVSCTRS
jgi:hypothetical protein